MGNMKFLLIASLFVLSVFAEPEAEADAQYGWNRGYGYNYPMSYGYNRWNNGYYGYGYNGYYPMTYGYNRWNNGYSGYGYNRYNNFNSYAPYNYYTRNIWGQRRYVREAEADSEADADYYNVGFYGNHQTGSRGYYE